MKLDATERDRDGRGRSKTSTDRTAGRDRRSRPAALQRAIGNQAVADLAEGGDDGPAVTSPGDRTEREAERVARAVVDEQATPAAGEREGATPDGDRAVQRSATSPGRPAVGGEFGDSLRSLRGGGSPLPESVRSSLEPQFGRDFGDVRVHTGSRADEVASSVNAEAFTVGRDVVFADGNYEPGTRQGQQLLAHELTHVVQQDGGGSLPAEGGHSQVSASAGATVARQKSKGKKDEEEKARRLGTVYDESIEGDMWGDPVEEDVQVRAHSIEGWQKLLKNAASRNNALQLNAFMAVSVGHGTFVATYDESERTAMSKIVETMDKPTREERVNLMVAMLTTEGVDLEDMSVVGTAGAYLLPKFIKQNLSYAVARIQRESKSDYDKYQVSRDAVSDFLGQAAWAWADVEDLYTPARTEQGKYVTHHIPAENNMEKVGAAGSLPGRSPKDVLVDEALAGAQTAALGAFAAKFLVDGGSPGAKEWTHEQFVRQIKQYGRILGGVAKQQEHIKSRNQAIISGAVDTAFAALGPLGGGLSIGVQISKAMAETAVKNATVTMAGSLAGQGGAATVTQFVDAFDVGLGQLTNDLGKDGKLPSGFVGFKQDLIDAFAQGMGEQ